VAITLADGARRWSMVKTGSSYLSQSELPLTFGLGPAGVVQAIEVTWPNGRVERLPGSAADESIAIEEGRGIVKRTPLVRETKSAGRGGR
jgi:enediyne biosynthesis protein E4